MVFAGGARGGPRRGILGGSGREWEEFTSRISIFRI